MVPKAVIVHESAQRMRFKIAANRGDASFFDRLDKKLTSAFPALDVHTNPVTATALITGGDVPREDIAAFGEHSGMFDMASDPAGRKAMALSVTAPLHAANRKIQQLTGGGVDLPAAIFYALLIFGAVELLRGKWRTPPWYTAFWYAFGLYSKSLIDQPVDALDFDADGD